MKFWLIRLGSIALGILGCFAIDYLAHVTNNDYTTRIFCLAGLYVTLAVSLNLINGITGQFSIGHAAFYQVGAYSAGYLSVHLYGVWAAHAPALPFHLSDVLWLLIALVFGGLMAGLAGLVVGLPSLRLKGDYLAIVTMGFGEIIRIIVQNVEALGGSYGYNITPKFQYVWLIWLLAFVCIAVCRNLLKTAHGLPFLAVREDEVAAGAMGVNVTRIKVTAFILGSMFAGSAGALLCHFEGFITPTTFAMDVSFIILTMVVLGGTGSITGSIVAALLLSYLPEYLRTLKAPDGSALTVTGASVVAALLAVAIGAGLIKKMIETKHGRERVGWIIGVSIGAFLSKFVLQLLLTLIPPLRNGHVEAGQLRMVIFAVTLIVLMLLRPQGMFGHHEFSLKWLAGLFRPKAKVEGVAA